MNQEFDQSLHRPKYVPLTPQRMLRSFSATLPHAMQSAQTWGVVASASTVWGTINSLLRAWQCERKRVERNGRTNPTPVTLLTFTIYPDLARVWYYFAEKFSESRDTNIVIVDCCGLLKPQLFPRAQVIPFCNFSHARKIDYFLRYEISARYVWLCDDDVMMVNRGAFQEGRDRFANVPNLAVISFAPRGWNLVIDNKTYRGMGSYSILFDRQTFIGEDLSFSPVQTQNRQVGRSAGYYDTADYANEQLIRRGYLVETREANLKYVLGFVGTSVTMLALFNSAQANGILQDEIRVNPQLGSYHLVGLDCDWQIANLYREIFAEKPRWIPPIEQDQIRNLARMLPEKEREKVTTQA